MDELKELLGVLLCILILIFLFCGIRINGKYYGVSCNKENSQVEVHWGKEIQQ